jgi:di/tricarboxylate transporter
MTPDIALTLTIIVVATILFATEKIRVDVVALLVLLTVSLTGLIDSKDAFAGFSNPAVITVWAVYIVSGGLFVTGVADSIGQVISKIAGDNETKLIIVIMITCGFISAFMNNVGATAVLLPAIVSISRKTKIPASKLLIPLAFSSLMGGSMTLIGTPANILATEILVTKGLTSIEFFEFTPMGLIVLTTGVLYMAIIGRHLLPNRKMADKSLAITNMRKYVSELIVSKTSPLVGKSLAQSNLGGEYDLTVISINRDEKSIIHINRDTMIFDNDILIVTGSIDNIVIASEALNVSVGVDKTRSVEGYEIEEKHIVEATLSPRSQITGLTLEEVRFREKYGINALAIWRYGEVITTNLRDVRLQFGDALLLQGPSQNLDALQTGVDFLVLEPVKVDRLKKEKAPIAIGTMVLVLALVIFGSIHISTAMVIGAVIMVLTKCLTMDEAYQSIDWKTVFLVAGMLPLGAAMENTGTAAFLADQVLLLTGNLGPKGVLVGIYLLAALITQPMSNAAAIVLVVPIAIDAALSLGVNHLTFTMAAVIGAATSFLSPVGHKANLLVYGPGGYRFFDYTKVGALLTLALMIVSIIFLPILWPLYP